MPETEVLASVAYLPFLRAGEVSGMLNMSSRDRARWTERDRGIFRAVGRSLTLALERAEHAEQLKEQNAELAAQTRVLEGMERLSHDLTLAGDRHALIRRSLELVLPLLPDGYGAFCERTGPVWQISVRVGDARNDDLRALSHLGFPVGQTPSFDRPFETREPFFQDVYDQSLDLTSELVAHVHSVATLPLVVSGEVAGIFTVSLFERHLWSAADRAMLTTTVRSLGLVIEGAIGVAQLAEERRVLALTNEELESFAYSASHDLRTPVRHVMSFADLTRGALASTPNEKAGRYLDAMQQAAVRMTDLIDAMLLLSRAGRQAVVLRLVDLNTLVAQVRKELTTTAPDRNIDCQVGSLPTVASDLNLLRQALTQLLDNALKFSGTRKEPQIQVWAEDRGAAWAVFVRDNGAGFDPTYRHKLFGVFQRLHSDKQFGGVGVGLATVRRIVIRLGGEVFAEGQVDHGATFGFTLPKDGPSRL
ncbi:sensor histidine kinase [Deinococcus altitudinis]|uniref:sensor histidine kinase n=1 Tax=Deinococcus altitudinis TaxID=468914 RepID=UPI0038919308